MVLYTLYHYYDRYENEVNNSWKLFEGLEIYEKPTPLRGKYLVLFLSFSRVRSDSLEVARKDFYDFVRRAISEFVKRYGPENFPETHQLTQERHTAANDILDSLLSEVKKSSLGKVYVIIDEYDQFTNELFAFSLEDFKRAVARNGFVRKFYETLKEYTAQGVIDRIFITGVTPLTLDAMTSGFNIVMNVSDYKELHGMLGFKEDEVKTILQSLGLPQEKLITKLRFYYNGYRFFEGQEKLYNPSLVLYYLARYIANNEEPLELVDENMKSDYDKLVRVVLLMRDEGFKVVRELIEEGKVLARLVRGFSTFMRPRRDELLSLAYYLGLLTIRDRKGLRYLLEVPNSVMTKLYGRVFMDLLETTGRLLGLPLRVDLDRGIWDLLEGRPEAFVEELSKLGRLLSERDWRELSYKALLIGLLEGVNEYEVRSEHPVNGGYVDLLMRSRLEGTYSWALELKYVPTKAKLSQGELETWRQQLKRYLQSPSLKELSLIKGLLIVFQGGKLIHWEELEK